MLVLTAGAVVFQTSGLNPLTAAAEPTDRAAISLPEPGSAPTSTALPSREAAAATSNERPSRGGTRTSPTETSSSAPAPGGCSANDQSAEHANGAIDASELCPLPESGQQLHGDAAAAWWQLNAAFKQRFGENVCVTDSYRSLAAQQQVYAAKPGLAAVPGTSNHGLAIAVDLCGGVETGYGEAYDWLQLRAADFGWQNPDWASPGGSRPEPWHWEYVGQADRQ